MKNKLTMSVIAIVMLLASNAVAYNLQITPGGSTDVTGSSFFDVFVVFNPDPGGNSLDSYGFNIGYDSSELIWNSTRTSNLPPDPLLEFSSPLMNSDGLIENFNGFVLIGIPPTITASTTLARISFDIKSPGVNSPAPDGLADIWFDKTSQGTGFTIDGNAVQMNNITTVGAPDIAVAPEPVSSILFLSGGGTFLLRRFVKKDRQDV